MNAEIVISGLCSILNPFGENPAMSDPGVIVVQTMGHQHGPEHDHIGYLAYDSDVVEVTGVPTAVSVPNTTFFYFPVDGWELVIDGITAGTPKPTSDHSFRDLVAHRDEYWPEAEGDFDRDVVPEPRKRPKKTAVKAWMRFGAGEISASRISKVPWRFTGSSGMTLQRHFAEEVVYSFSVAGNAVVIQLYDLESEAAGEKLTFKLRDSSSTVPLSLILGNNTQIDLPQSLFREVTEHVEHPYSTHFAFLNQTAKVKDGPIPVAINPKDDGGGGGSGGACGPGSGNGRPTS
jgi:hypothetical protein